MIQFKYERRRKNKPMSNMMEKKKKNERVYLHFPLFSFKRGYKSSITSPISEFARMWFWFKIRKSSFEYGVTSLKLEKKKKKTLNEKEILVICLHISKCRF